MSSFQFNITHKCNLNCPFCYSIIRNSTMSKDVIDKAIEFIINRIKLEPKGTPHLINFSGGELFLGNYDLIPYAIKEIKSSVKEEVEFNIQTNLTVLDVEQDKIANEIIDLVDMVGTSWDSCRFTNEKNERMFWKNFNYISSKGKRIEVIECLTKDYIKMVGDDITPRLQMWYDKGVRKIEISKLGKPIEDKGFYSVKPLNKEQNEFLVKAYIKYKDFQKKNPDFTITSFQCMEDAVNGMFHYEHSRNCQKDMFTITPEGLVGQCIMTVARPFYNLMTKELNIDNYNYHCQLEENVNPKCLNCKYYKYCNGNCFNIEWDNTGCPTPYEIFDLIERNKNGSKC